MRRALPSLLLVACVAAVVGCGGGGSSSTTSSTRAAAKAATTPEATATTTSTVASKSEGCTAVSAPTTYPSRTHETKPTSKLDPHHAWTVILDTNCGLISIDLAVAQAPETASSFAALVQRRFFDGLSFHRVATNPDGSPFVIQGGDPLGDGSGGPGYSIVEPPPSNVRYTRGVVAMAKESAEASGTSGSQFFIVTAPDAQLPAQYALLGHVSSGMAAVSRIAALPTNGNEMPLSPVVIRSATLTEH
jgi:peptidyl-prolyl cis-trans isomerase B (cyclophilin B)